MSSKTPNFHIGTTAQKRNVFMMQHDTETSCNFGELQPTYIREMIPGSSIHVKTTDFVRLAPMPNPPFARMSLRTYNVFVPARLCYPYFNQVISGLPVNVGDDEYTVSEVPFITQKMFFDAFHTASHLHLEELDALMHYNLYVPAGSSIQIAPGLDPRVMTDSVLSQFSAVDDSSPFHSSVGNYGEYDSTIQFTQFDAFIPIYRNSGGIYLTDGYIVIKFTALGKRLMKVLHGLGYHFVRSNDEQHFSALPLFAYLRAYYEILAPKREDAFEQSYLHGVYQEFANNPAMWLTVTNLRQLLFDIRDVCYTYDSDYYTSCIAPSSGEESFQITGLTSTGERFTATDEYAGLANDEVFSLSQKLASMVNKLVNRSTIVGKNIKNWLKSEYNVISPAELYNESYFINSHITPVVTQDIYATVNNDSTELGQYGGRGIGTTDSRNVPTVNFEAKEFGFFIMITTLVPQTGYFQGIQRQMLHTKRFDFFNPTFDGIGYQPVTNQEIYADSYQQASNGVFGLVPRYAEYTVNQQDTVNGDFYFGSSRPLLHGWDAFRDFKSLPVNNEEFKKLNAFDGNSGSGFLRIFNYEGSDADHFFINIFHDIKLIQNKKSYSESFDVVDNGVGDFEVNYV